MTPTNRTPIHEVYRDHTDAQVKDAMNAAILAAVGAVAPAPAARPRTRPAVTREWHDRLIAAEAADRARTAPRTVPVRDAAGVVGIDVRQAREIAAEVVRDNVPHAMPPATLRRRLGESAGDGFAEADAWTPGGVSSPYGTFGVPLSMSEFLGITPTEG